MSSNNSSLFINAFQRENNTHVHLQGFEIRILTRCFFFVTMIIAVTGNVLVITAIATSTKLQSYKNNWLLCNLAVADLLQGAIAVPLRIVETFPSFANYISCRVAIPLSILFGGTSNITILFISVERFLAIYYPFFHIDFFTSKVAKSLIGFSWFTVGFFSLISATHLTWNEKNPSQHMRFCRFPVYLRKEYIWSLYSYVHIIPISLVVVLYGFILKASCQQAHRIHQQNVAVCINRFSRSGKLTLNAKSSSNLSLYLKKFKGIKVVSVVVGLFIVLVLPIVVIDVIDVVQGTRPSPDVVQLAVCMIYANNCVNVFVYAGFNQEYRQNFKRILRRIFCWSRRC
ncbi:trace amine-associated receptor 7e-like [Actinia tenebrosa]|uniref:Trace amine-associated receptor 7e-like n=1 Tax=Actinia tenebrosa TaxID=6105 RepID=A0A6P8HI25_ACTTE|nr:trace amine-associated receptor 7e-like [Actinia tenebrosa]